MILLLALLSSLAQASTNGTAISATSLPLPTGASTSANQSTALTTLSGIKTGTDKIPSSPSQEHTTAASPNSCRISDGAAFLDPRQVTVQNASLAVTGTFFQATQPVSFTQPALVASSAVIGHVIVDTAPSTAVTNAGTFAVQAAQSGTWTVQPGNTANTTAWKVDGSAVNQPVSGTVTIIPPTLTKGTQGATGIGTQDLKDAGRNQTNYFMALPIVTTATDALMSLTGYKAGAAVVATTTPAVVTAAKTYRITSVHLTYVAIATAGSAKFTLRANTGGVVAITSPAVTNWVVGGPAAAAGVAYSVTIDFPDGMEFAAGTGIGISMVGLGATQTAAAVGYGLAAVHGFEY